MNSPPYGISYGAWLEVRKELAEVKAQRDRLLKACIFARNEMVVKTEGEHGAYQYLEEVIANVKEVDNE